MAEQTVKDGGTAVKSETPTRTGYVFDGWYLGSSSATYSFSTPATASITLTAKWTEEGDDGNSSPVTGNKITAAVEDGALYNTEVDNVKALLDGSDFVAGSGAYANGGFTVNLNATVDTRYLEPIKIDFLIGEGVTVSNPNAMTVMVWDLIAYKSGVRAGEFIWGKDLKTLSLCYMYADRDVTVTGSDEYFTYNMSLKKGWNIWYWTLTEDDVNFGTYYTGAAVPDGVKWTYSPDSDVSSYSAKTASRLPPTYVKHLNPLRIKNAGVINPAPATTERELIINKE